MIIMIYVHILYATPHCHSSSTHNLRQQTLLSLIYTQHVPTNIVFNYSNTAWANQHCRQSFAHKLFDSTSSSTIVTTCANHSWHQSFTHNLRPVNIVINRLHTICAKHNVTNHLHIIYFNKHLSSIVCTLYVVSDLIVNNRLPPSVSNTIIIHRLHFLCLTHNYNKSFELHLF